MESALPIESAVAAIEASLREARVTIISGETGCGKSTRVPQIALAALGGRVLVSQPRRIAAVNMANRVGAELSTRNPPIEVGYSVRFADTSTPQTAIHFVTDGVLLKILQENSLFERYNALIVDEVHERTVFLDVSLFLLKRALNAHPNFRLVLMSATIDLRALSAYFSEFGPRALTIPVARRFPLNVQYGADGCAQSAVRRAAETVAALHASEGEGDFLVFLPGAGECFDCLALCQRLLNARANAGEALGGARMSALFGAQSVGEQSVALRGVERPDFERKIVFTTNIAETSLTVENVAVVVDTGLAKQVELDERTAAPRLVLGLASQAQSMQRAGRAGRTRPGKVFRLYSERTFHERMAAESAPELRRVELHNLVLAALRGGATNLSQLDFIERPTLDALNAGASQLFAVGLIASGDDGALRLTALGELAARLPLDPFFARTLLAGRLLGVESALLDIAAALGGAEPLTPRGAEKDALYLSRKASVGDERGDAFCLLALLAHCRDAFDSVALGRFRQTRSQLATAIARFDAERLRRAFADDLARGDFEGGDVAARVSRCLLFAFPQNIAKLSNAATREYAFLFRGGRAFIAATSVYELRGAAPEFVFALRVAAEAPNGIAELSEVIAFSAPKFICDYKAAIERWKARSNKKENFESELEKRKGKVLEARERYRKRIGK